MAQEVRDQAPGGGALPPSAAADNQLNIREDAFAIFDQFRRSSTIPTEGRRRRGEPPVQRRPAAPKPTPAPLVEAPMTLADLRRQLAGEPAAAPAPRATVVDEDGGYDSATLRDPNKPVSGASLAAGALRAMRPKT